jgi:phospholipid-translocating ATPase
MEIDCQLKEAREALIDREGSVARVFNNIESSLTLLGATGVEDQLQDGVSETLESLKVAGICVIKNVSFMCLQIFNKILKIRFGC